ncbi:MAG: hypothetical protein AAF349_21080 [Cyanobacteria bacterium P01_A01_bin.68]
MLQIGSGKLYSNSIGRKNILTGVIYSNLRISGEEKLETAAGSILPTSYLHDSLALVYQYSEFMEKADIAPGVLISHGIKPYISDFSVVLSFALNCVATPDYILSRRLLSNQRGLSTPAPPQKIVTQFFDQEIVVSAHEKQHLEKFVKQLIGLERKYFLGVMRAMRTYITGMHRIADDLELAYTLIVASIESLAQDFDGYESTWEDIDYRKQKMIDGALEGADSNIGDKIRAAILDVEHTALSRRFKEFTLEHVSPSFFRQEVVNIDAPISKSDLFLGLNQAYKARSKYIHNLRELPKLLTMGNLSVESTVIEKNTWITFQGLTRLARHVITQFILRQPTIESEKYDYTQERAGVVQVPLAPEYWVGNYRNLSKESGAKRLGAFLQQYSQCLLSSNSKITDLSSVLNTVESQLPQMKRQERLPFITLYLLFNGLLPNENRMEGARKVEERFAKEILEPSPESLILSLLFDRQPDWGLSVHEETLLDYFKYKDRKKRVRLPKLFEAGVTLFLAERYRFSGDLDKALKYVSYALENYPENKSLREFEADFQLDNTNSIIWDEVLLFKRDNIS